MAYKKPVEDRSYPHLYNVTMTVGSRKSAFQVPGGGWVQSASYEPNKRDDVMLVQYLLKRVYQKGVFCEPPLSGASGAALMKIDGYHGPQTQKAIDYFQLEMRKNGRSIATDGCVDTEGPQGSTATISNTGYTISWLNKYFYILYPELFPNIAVDPECPPELRQSVGESSPW